MTTKITNVRIARSLTVAGTASLLAITALLAPVEAGAATKLTCSASVSTSSPRQYSTVSVTVRTKAKAKVRTVAHYKTTDTAHSATAGSSGVAVLDYRLSRATKGWRVPIDVTVSLSGRSGSCRTSFTPR